jgi:hypothetical protein
MSNDDLKDEAGRTIIYQPIILVESVNGKQQYRIHITELDKLANEPTLFGLLLSDLADHIARAYEPILGHPAKRIREHIVKVMSDEDRFKTMDPSRGKIRGVTIMPKGKLT